MVTPASIAPLIACFSCCVLFRTVREAIKQYKAVYLVTIGGAGALLSKSIKQAEVIAYNDLGPEAILRLSVENFPAIVANDINGGDLFIQERAKYKRDK